MKVGYKKNWNSMWRVTKSIGGVEVSKLRKTARGGKEKERNDSGSRKNLERERKERERIEKQMRVKEETERREKEWKEK